MTWRGDETIDDDDKDEEDSRTELPPIFMCKGQQRLVDVRVGWVGGKLVGDVAIIRQLCPMRWFASAVLWKGN